MEPTDPFDGLREDDTPSSRPEFHAQLDACDVELIELSTKVTDAIVPMTEAFLSGDALAAQQLIAADAEVDRRCAALEERCFILIARQSPVADDLRRLVAVLRCINDVARSGDLLRHVGESLKWIHPPSLPEKLRETIGQLGVISAKLFDLANRAWEDRDALAVNDLEREDDQVDLLQKVLLTDLYTGTQSVEEAVSLALITRYYERIADHAVEISRQVSYVVTGDRPEA